MSSISTDELENRDLRELVRECQSHEHWGDRRYRYKWVAVVNMNGGLHKFHCEEPKRVARDYRERFITE